ncbi:MAG: NAD-dependent epimerase/dehydratase family protein [Richelia sp. SL_2_1]|nr:NAD-dependent epimerase/dehydratase family protein [Richelia sp. SL_2_1]
MSLNAQNIQNWMVSQLAEQLTIEADEIDIQEPLDSYGLDSAQAMILASKAEKLLGFELPLNLLWLYPTIEALSERLAEEIAERKLELETGNTRISKLEEINLDLGAEVVLDPTIDPLKVPLELKDEPENIFVTGGTGFLGAFLIEELLQQTKANIYCLIRAGDVESGRNRLLTNLQHYQVWHDKYGSRIIPVLGDLSKPLLGLSREQFNLLATTIDIIYHSAALLNYVYPYSAMKAANVLGTQEILRLASQIKRKPVHYVSSVAIFESTAYTGKIVQESDSFDDHEGIFLGYSQTKWVAEKLVKLAGSLGLPVTIYRPPLISGHSKTGVSNTEDFICLMLKGCVQMGSFPDIDYWLDMSPVDYVSRAIVYLSQQPKSVSKAFHLQHPQPIHLSQLVNWISTLGYDIEQIPYEDWLNKLQSKACSPDNPLYTLKPFLLQRWTEEQLTATEIYIQARRPAEISCQQTLNALAASDIICPPLEPQLFSKYLSYLLTNPQIGATTGNRWYLPQGRYWGSVIRYIWNVAAVLQMYFYQMPWGGSLAIKREVFHQTGLLSKWKKAFNEDTIVLHVLQQQGLRVEFVPSILMLNREECDLKSFFGWVKRQLLCPRLYHTSWSAIAIHGILTTVLPLTAIMLLLITYLHGELSINGYFPSGLAIYIVTQILCLVILEYKVRGIFQRKGETVPSIDVRTIFKVLLALPLTQIVYALALTEAMFIRQVEWRGITYQIKGPWDIKLVKYQPYSYSEKPVDSIVSL